MEWQQVNTVVTHTTQKNSITQQINEIKEDLNKQRATITQRKRAVGNTLLAVQEFVWLVAFKCSMIAKSPGITLS